jgi:hypothetical protein
VANQRFDHVDVFVEPANDVKVAAERLGWVGNQRVESGQLREVDIVRKGNPCMIFVTSAANKL